MTASSLTAADAMPPPSSPTPSELSALRAKLSAVEALNSGLREENNRVQAALAVERAARDGDELTRLRRDVHLISHRLSRALRLFDAVGLDPPDPQAPLEQFITDEFLEHFPALAARSLAKRVGQPILPGDETEMGDAQPTPERDNNDAQTTPKEPVEPPAEVAKEVAPTSQPAEQPAIVSSDGNAQAQAQAQAQMGSSSESVPPPNAATPPAEKPPIVVDETNPTAECLRMLIGADSISLYEDPARIKIDMTNDEKKRALSFWLQWKDGVIEYTRQSVEVEDDSCPNFLREYSIEFEVAQAPNFLVLVMGAMFDFRIEPKSEPTLEEDPAAQDETMREDDPVLLDS